MPELPEVELARRQLVRWFKGREVVRAEAEKARTFRSGKRSEFEKLKGPLKRADRRGKYLMLEFGNGAGLMAHLGMTGKFVKRAAGVTEPYSRARWVLDSGEVIHFRDPRMFGEMLAAPAAGLAKLKAVAKLGFDPLVDGITVEQLKDGIATSKQGIKVALMDQERVAGLGNIHAAEALFRAKIHPARVPKTLKDAEWQLLVDSIQAALDFGLSEQGADHEEIEYVEEPGANNPFLIYGRAGEPCKVCGTMVKSFHQAGRTTFFCPHCQPKRPAVSKPTKKKKRSKR